MFRKCMLSLFFLTLVGCNSIKGVTFPDNFVEQTPSNHHIMNFPHIAQYDGYSCATTSLAMVMSHYDHQKYRKSDVWKASGSSKTQVTRICGNDMDGLKRAAEKYGFTEYEFVRGMTLEELKYLIAQDIPVIVNIRNFFQESYHAVVVTGYDEKGLTFFDPAKSRYAPSYKKDYKTFLNKWYASLCSPRGQKQRNTAFILYPKQ